MKLGRYAPDMKIVVGVIAASYVATILFGLVPTIAPGNIVSKLGIGKAA